MGIKAENIDHGTLQEVKANPFGVGVERRNCGVTQDQKPCPFLGKENLCTLVPPNATVVDNFVVTESGETKTYRPEKIYCGSDPEVTTILQEEDPLRTQTQLAEDLRLLGAESLIP